MMARSGRTNETRTTLRWKLVSMVAAIVVGVAALFLALTRDAVRRFVRADEIERLRSGPMATLKQRCTDYLIDRDRADVEKLMAALVAQHDEVAYICFRDGALEGNGLLSSRSEWANALLALVNSAEPAPPEGRPVRIGDETVLDVTEATATKPPYTLHLGLRTSTIDERTRNLLVRMTVITVVIAAGAVAVAFGLIMVIISPLATLVADATRLSLGDMRVAFRPRGRGELGRLADALDRLKESLLAALKRSGKK